MGRPPPLHPYRLPWLTDTAGRGAWASPPLLSGRSCDVLSPSFPMAWRQSFREPRLRDSSAARRRFQPSRRGACHAPAPPAPRVQAPACRLSPVAPAAGADPRCRSRAPGRAQDQAAGDVRGRNRRWETQGSRPPAAPPERVCRAGADSAQLAADQWPAPLSSRRVGPATLGARPSRAVRVVRVSPGCGGSRWFVANPSAAQLAKLLRLQFARRSRRIRNLGQRCGSRQSASRSDYRE